MAKLNVLQKEERLNRMDTVMRYQYGHTAGIARTSEISIYTSNRNAVPVVNCTNISQCTIPVTGGESTVTVRGIENIPKRFVHATNNTDVAEIALNSIENMDTFNSNSSQEVWGSSHIHDSSISVADNVNSLRSTVTGDVMNTSTCMPESSSVSTEIPSIAMKKVSKNSAVIKFTDILKLKEKENIDIVEWLIDLGLLASEYECPCGKKMKLTLKYDRFQDEIKWACGPSGNHRRLIYRCIRAGTIFGERRGPLIDIMLYIHCWVYEIPSDWIYLEVFSTHAVIDWSNKCRDVCLEVCARDEKKIGGENSIVFIDGDEWEKTSNIGHEIEVKWVFSGIEEIYLRKYFFRIVKECSKQAFLEVVESSILPGTTIVSEYCFDYNCFEDEDFLNLQELYEYKFDIPENHSNLKIKTWKNYMKHMPPHKSKYGFDNYIAEYAWRKNAKAKDKMRNFIEAIRTVYTPHIKDLPTEK